MQKKEKPVYAADGFRFDSRDEMDFYFFIAEAAASGMIGAWSYHPQTIELSPKVTYFEQIRMKTKTKTVEHVLLNPCSYTPDFTLMLHGPRSWLLRPYFRSRSELIWIDVKGAFSIHNDDVKFSLIKKWLYQRKKIYVQKIKTADFFEQTFVPRRAAFNRNGSRRAAYAHCRTRIEFLEEKNDKLNFNQGGTVL